MKVSKNLSAFKGLTKKHESSTDLGTGGRRSNKASFCFLGGTHSSPGELLKNVRLGRFGPLFSFFAVFFKGLFKAVSFSRVCSLKKTTEDADESPFTFPVDCFVHAAVGEGGGPGGFKKK